MGQNCVLGKTDTYENDSDVNYCNLTVIYSYREYRILTWLEINSRRIYFPIGILGNILTILILLRMRPWKIWNVYVLVLAVSDSFVLLQTFCVWEITTVFTPELCTFILFFGITMREFSYWVIVCMTVERFFVIWFPLRISGSNVRRAYWLLTLLAFVLALHNITYFWIGGDQWNPVTAKFCKPVAVYEHFVAQYWHWIRASVLAIVPFIIVFFANIFIIAGWILSNRRHRELTNRNISVEDVYKHVHVTAMITAVSVFFTLAVVPNVAVYIFVNFNDEHSLRMSFIIFYFLVFVDLNYCSNFFLYCASSKEFRKQMKLMFFEICTPCNNVRNISILR